MKTKEEILEELPQFYGTDSYYRLSELFPMFVLTDGAHYLAEAAGAFWLMDAIASYWQQDAKEGFAACSLRREVVRPGFTLTIEDGNDTVLAEQYIEYSDFPLDHIMLYVATSGDLWVILLTTEY